MKLVGEVLLNKFSMNCISYAHDLGSSNNIIEVTDSVFISYTVAGDPPSQPMSLEFEVGNVPFFV